MSDDANHRPGDTRAIGESPIQEDPRAHGRTGPEQGEEPAAGTADEPVQPGELQAGDRSELAQTLGGPVDVSPGRGRRSSQGRGKNVVPSDGNMAARVDLGDRPDPDDEVDLVVSLATVVGIIDAARAVGELEEEATNEEVQDPEVPDEVDPDGLADTVKGPCCTDICVQQQGLTLCSRPTFCSISADFGNLRANANESHFDETSRPLR